MRRDLAPARLLYRVLERTLLPWLEKSGVSPDGLTVTGVVISGLAGLSFLYSPLLAGCLALLGGLCDALDGFLARATGRTGPRGAFVDSVLDRYAEVFLFLGAWAYLGRHPHLAMPGAAAALAAVFGANMVSYTRARGEGLGVCFQNGLFTRDERLLILAAGALADPLSPGYVVLASLGLVALGANLSALYRYWKIKNLLSPTETDRPQD
ncbi:MAG: CDP-alcohol phosphatidyltransferase family protein [Thermodesulfobacteriota bacterium]